MPRGDRDAQRTELFEAIDTVRRTLVAEAAKSREARTLTPTTVAALRDSGLLRFKMPAEVGGYEADPMLQFDVIEALTLIDPGAAWCTMITSAVAGNTAARHSDEAVKAIFTGERTPTFAGTLRPSGRAVQVEGGYEFTGRWQWGSGINHAEWVSVRALAEVDGKTVMVNAAVPVDDVDLHDNWHVMGMESTGSCDYSLDGRFVPAAFVIIEGAPPRRGGPIYRLGVPGFVINEHAAIVLGIARKSLDALLALAREKARGYGASRTLADREVLQRDIARADLRLRADRLLVMATLEALHVAACTGDEIPARLQADARAAAVLANDDALEITSMALRYGAGTAVFLEHELQQNHRDLQVAATHLMVTDASYENYGRFLLGTTDRVDL